MARGLANLNGLRALEAVMRHRSYIHAAEELHVTPAAVGQQIRALEAWLGLALFERNRSSGARLVPLPHAAAAMADLSAGFAQIERGLAQLQRASDENVVKVSTSPAFGGRWLMPRIGGFQRRHPDVDLRLDISDRVVDLLAGEADCAIRYGIGPWHGLAATLLMSEELFPAASPVLVNRFTPVTGPGDLLEWPLIEDGSGSYMPDFPNWQRWFAQRAGMGLPVNPTIQVNLAAAALDAAIEGAGVALVRSVAAQEDLRSGRLVRLLPDVPGLASPAAYWLIVPPAGQVRAGLRAFTAWICAEMAAGQPD